jgi:hypothetical protein
MAKGFVSPMWHAQTARGVCTDLIPSFKPIPAKRPRCRPGVKLFQAIRAHQDNIEWCARAHDALVSAGLIKEDAAGGE